MQIKLKKEHEKFVTELAKKGRFSVSDVIGGLIEQAIARSKGICIKRDTKIVDYMDQVHDLRKEGFSWPKITDAINDFHGTKFWEDSLRRAYALWSAKNGQ